MAMTLSQWLGAVRPGGRGYVFSMDLNSHHPDEAVRKTCKKNTRLFNSDADAETLIKASNTRNDNAFITLAKFQDHSTGRGAEFADSLKSLWIDIDCSSSKAYQTKDQAIAAAKSFCLACSFPKPSIIIDSGGGIHLYWCFDSVIDVSEWIPLSNDLKKLCDLKGFGIDPSVMGDAARVMRVPGSFNYKDSNDIKPVEIIFPQTAKLKLYNANKLHELIKSALPKQRNNLTSPSQLVPAPVQASKFKLPIQVPEGGRNTTLLRLAGSLRGQGMPQADIEQRLIHENLTRCSPPLDTDEVLSVARRYAIDSYDILSDVSSEAELGDSNQNSIPEVQNPIEELNTKFAWDFGEMNLYNIATGAYVLKDRFITQYANRLLDVGTEERPKLVQLGTAWFTQPLRRSTPRVILAPGQPETLSDGSINSWRGFVCEPTKGDVKPFIKLLKKLIPNIHERRYVLSWFASLVQKPSQKFNVALVIWSRQQGTGKSLLVETIGNLFDDRHFEVVGQEVFNDGFTDWQAHKVMVVCDEVSSTDKRAVADRIKGWITASKNNINAKNAPKFKQPNLIKYVFLSNHADAVYLDETDRRFYVVEASSDRLPKEDSWAFVQWRDGAGKAALLHYLLNLNIKDFNPTAPAPVSNSKEAMFEDNKSDLERWMDATVEELLHGKKYLISSEALAIRYRDETGHSCSSKTITSALRVRGVTRLNKQARMSSGSKNRLFALKDAALYEAMTDKELGAAFSGQIFNK